MHVAPFCAGCNGAIFDRYFLSVAAAGAEQQVWHCTCLKCAVCGVNLDPGVQGPERSVCFYKDGQLLCREDYYRRYRDGTSRNCALCQRGISSAELVMKLAGGQWVYHVECFRCGVCGQPLRTGDQFALRPDGHVLCRAHHQPPPPHPHPVPVIHYADSAENLSHAPLEQYAAAGPREPLDLQILREMAASGRALPMLEPRSPKPTYMTLGDPEPKAADKKRPRVRGPRRRRSSTTSQFEMQTEPENSDRMGHVQFGGREVRRPRRSVSVTSSASTEQSPPCGGDDDPEPGCSPPGGLLSLGYMQGGRGMQLPPLHLQQRDSSSPNSASGPHQHHAGQSASQRTKRMRTSFKHQQLRTMKQYFGINHNPDAKDLKQLAQKTGLSKRVLQVWFQNARAKYRRSLLKQDGGAGTSLSSGCAGDDSPPSHVEGGHMSLSPESLLHGEHSDAPSPLGGEAMGHYASAPAALHYY